MASCGCAAQYRLWPPVAVQPSAGCGLLIHEVSCSHTTTRHIRQDSSGRVISSSQRPLPQCFPTAGPGINYRAARGKYFILEIF
jgi:hypothetical protein